MLAELDGVLRRHKFHKRLTDLDISVDLLVASYASIATLVHHRVIPPTIADDPDDDLVLATALGASANLIVSGDRHLLALGEYQGVLIKTPTDALTLLGWT